MPRIAVPARAALVVVLGLGPPSVLAVGCAGSGEEPAECCTENDFQVGGTIPAQGQAGVALQAVADLGAIASALVDDLTAACRSIAEELDVDQAERQTAERIRDKSARMEAFCELAVRAIGDYRVATGGALSVSFQPPECETSVTAKAACQAKCVGTESCDPHDNPPTCEHGLLELSCKGDCTAPDSSSVWCKGTCEGECTGSCTDEGGARCQGRCNGTCEASGDATGIQPDGSCDGLCHGTCELTAEGASCAGTCNGQCEGTCHGSSELSVECDGDCSGAFEPLTCIGGKLGDGCREDYDCEQACGLGVQAKTICRPTDVAVRFSGDVDAPLAGKLKLVLEARLGVVIAQSARAEAIAAVFPYGFAIGSDVPAPFIADIKEACIPFFSEALARAATDVGLAAYVAVDLLGSVS